MSEDLLPSGAQLVSAPDHETPKGSARALRSLMENLWLGIEPSAIKHLLNHLRLAQPDKPNPRPTTEVSTLAVHRTAHRPEAVWEKPSEIMEKNMETIMEFGVI